MHFHHNTLIKYFSTSMQQPPGGALLKGSTCRDFDSRRVPFSKVHFFQKTNGLISLWKIEKVSPTTGVLKKNERSGAQARAAGQAGL